MSEDKPWHEDDDFWETLYPLLFSERRWEAVEAEADAIIELLSLRPGARILDLCCGPGRHSLELARRDFVVTGVDRTSMYIQKAKAAADENPSAVKS